MAALIFVLILLAGAIGLGMARASPLQWAVGLGAAIFAWQSGVFHGAFHAPALSFWGLLAWLPVVVLAALSVPSLRRKFVVEPTFRMVKGILPKVSDTEQQALDAGTVGFDAELFSGTPGLDEAARRAAHRAVLGGTRLSRRAHRRTLPDDRPLGGAPFRSAHPRSHLGLREAQRLPRHADLEGPRWPRVLAAGAVAYPGQDRIALARRRHHRHGAELARTRRADREIRHRRAEALLSAAPRAGPRSPMLLADGTDVRLRRGHHARHRLRHARHARRPRGHGHQPHLGQALHYARPGGDARRSRVPPVRPRQHSGPRRRHRHHRRSDPGQASRRQHRPPPSAIRRRIPQWSQLGPRRLHSDGLGHRRRSHGGPGLAHADGMPGCGPRHLAAVVGDGRRQGHAARDHGLCPHPPPVRLAHRAHGGHRRAARAHGRERLRQRGGPRRNGSDGLARRASVGDLGADEIPDDRAPAPDPSTMPSTFMAAAPSATARRTICSRPISSCRSASPSKAPIS